MPHVRSERGFTLVEVLVALLIMAIVATLSWQGIDGIIRSSSASNERLEKVLRLQAVLLQWEQDLHSVQDSGTVPPVVFMGPAILLTRQSPEGLQVVSWSLREGRLSRWVSAPTQTTRDLAKAWERGEDLLRQDAGQVRALLGVAAWQQHCFRANAWSNCQSDSDAGQPVPEGVRLILTFNEGSGYAGSVTRDVALRR